MLTFSGNPEFLKDYSVAGFRVAQVIGEIGELTIDLEARKPSDGPVFDEHAKLQGMLGVEITCEMEGWSFTGTIETVSYSAVTNDFSLVARDALAKLEDNCVSQVFSETTLEDIVGVLFAKNGPSSHRFVGDLGSSKISLAIQYQESHLAFLRRVVSRCGGQFWCLGDEVILGNAPDEKSGELRLGRDVLTYSMATGAGRESVEMTSIAYVDKNRAESETVELKKSGFGKVQDGAIGLRAEKEPPGTFHIVHEDSAYGDIKLRAQNILRAKASNRFVVSGSSKVPVKLGAQLDLKGYDKANRGEERVETVFVRALVGGSPSGYQDTTWEFEAANLEALLAPSDTLQNTLLTSTAVVQQTAEAMNRVKVCFPWDSPQTETPWLRVASPSWGKDHFHYIPPKEGDTVLVMWGQWDMDAVVLASLPAGDEVSAPSDVCVLQTVEGHTVSIDGEHIHILNEANGGGTKVDVSPDRVVVETSDGHAVEIGSDKILLSHAGGSSLAIDGGKIAIESAGDVVIKATGNLELSNAAASVKMSGPSVSINNGALEIT